VVRRRDVLDTSPHLARGSDRMDGRRCAPTKRRPCKTGKYALADRGREAMLLLDADAFRVAHARWHIRKEERLLSPP